MNNRVFITVLIILTFAVIISFVSYAPERLEKTSGIKMADFPKIIGEWVSEDIPLQERVYELLETDNLIMRNYTNKRKEAVNLYIIYSQDNRKVAHPPEICLQGAGATITSKSAIQINDSIRATKLIIEKGAFKELVVYLYKVEKLNTNSYLKQQLRMVLNRMAGKKTSIAFIRMLVEIKENREDVALNRIKDFFAVINPLLDKYVP